MNTLNNLDISRAPDGATSGPAGKGFPWMETVGLTVIIPVFKLGLAVDDPFLIEKGFPWLVVLPLLIGLRHGSAHALVSALTLIMGISAGMHLGYVHGGDYPASVTIAFLVLGLIGGEYKGFWATRVDRVADSERYHKARLDQFAKVYHMLRQSHDRLEHHISANVHSIRTALTDLHTQLTSLEPRPEEAFHGASASILKLMSDHGLVQIAALYQTGADGKPAGTALATLGRPMPLERDDPLLREALRTGQAVAVSADQETRGTALMAVVPIVDFDGRLWGVVTIDELPFVALQAENLNLLSAFGGHIGDCLARWTHLTTGEADARGHFENDLRRALVEARRCASPAVVLALSVGADWQESGLLEKLMLNGRSLDRLLIDRNESGGITLLKLMPCTDPAGAESYRFRLQMLARSHLGDSHETDLGKLKIFPLDPHTDMETLLVELSPWLPPSGRRAALAIGGACTEGGVRC